MLTFMNEVSGEGKSLRWSPLVVILAVAVIVVLGKRAWDTGHDVAFALLVIAAVVGVGLERVRVAIRQSR